MTLLAVGGYGRGELAPGSDLDVVLVHRGRRDIGDVANRVWYPIWDAGVALDHSVRTRRDLKTVAESDRKVALGFLDGRVVAGDRELGEAALADARRSWASRGRRWLPAIKADAAARHQVAGPVAFLLEPDLKDGEGGLRDIGTARLLAATTPVVDRDDVALDDAHDVLLGARVELHRLAIVNGGRPSDRLSLQEQDAVAIATGYRDADELMAAIAAAARRVAWSASDAWRRVDSWLVGPKGRGAGGDRALGRGVARREGEVVLATDADPRRDRTLVLRAAAAAAHEGTTIAPATLRRLADEAVGPGGPGGDERWDDESRAALVSLLGAGAAGVALLETLDQAGLLVRVLPEWEPVRSRPQRNAYHRFTVDRHLCETAAEAGALTRHVGRPDLLLVGAWLHDLGKGYPGDHTDAGIALMQTIGPRLGFDERDTALLVAMVRHHLLLPDVATRRDLDDPATVDAVAAAVGDRDTLELLAALTEADSRATGESAWSPWKAGLVRDLVARVTSRLAGAPADPGAGFPSDAQASLIARARAAAVDHVLVDVDGQRVTVVAPDQPGLLARVAGTLAVHGLAVVAARAWPVDGALAYEELDIVLGAAARSPDAARLQHDVAAAIAGRLPIEARLAERARTYASRSGRRAARVAEPRVLVDDEASATASVVEVRAPDAIGLLYRIARALADLGLDVRHAKVATLGHEVVDTFYVTERDGTKLSAGRVIEVEHALLAAVEPEEARH